MTQREIQHLYLRAGFGASIDATNRSMRIQRAKILDQLFADSAHPTPFNVVRVPTQEEVQMAMAKEKTPEEKKQIREYIQEENNKLNLTWLNKMMIGNEILNEKMTFFWHDHFACKPCTGAIDSQDKICIGGFQRNARSCFKRTGYAQVSEQSAEQKECA